MTEPLTLEQQSASTISTPWMTVEQAAVYSRYSYETVRRACVQFQRDNTRGLKCTQPVPNGHYRLHRDDVDRWVEKKPPISGRRGTTR